ncbi:MAG: hypothetical protein NTZ10_06860 [Candidatus Saganbacteria bacterium]|nr:hypothetical protein [Candidatus Saganbacteria bacterium]
MKKMIATISLLLIVSSFILCRVVTADDDEYIFTCTASLNNYNFHILFNNMLGYLYKSHGCMHLSPYNSWMLYKLLPVGSRITIKPYPQKIDNGIFSSTPYLVELIQYESDVEDIAKKLSEKNACTVELYPGSEILLIRYKGSPFGKMYFVPGPENKMYPMQGRDEKGLPYFDDNQAYPTTTGTFYVFKKVIDYHSPTYRDTTEIPMGSLIIFKDGEYVYRNPKGVFIPVPEAVEQDLSKKSDDRNFEYFKVKKDDSGKIIEAGWGSNTFGKYALMISKDKKTMFPELIHTSGDLMMEELKFIKETVGLLVQPGEDFDSCVASSEGFWKYKAYYDFTKDPSRDDLLQDIESAYYKLYFDIPLDDKELSLMPKDAIVANKFVKAIAPLSPSEEDILISSRMAKRTGGKFFPDTKKILGMQQYTHQCAVGVDKFANFYRTVKDNWGDLINIRRNIADDCVNTGSPEKIFITNFGIKLLVERSKLKKLTQDSVTDIYNVTDRTKAIEFKFKY